MSKIDTMIPLETIERKIFVIRGERVMLDSDLAAVYGVSTKRFNEQVKRNTGRFPNDFMFQLTDDEYESLRFQTGMSNDDSLRSQFAASKDDGMRSQNATASKRNIRFLPYVFTEHGALMAANVLKSSQAVEKSRA